MRMIVLTTPALAPSGAFSAGASVSVAREEPRNLLEKAGCALKCASQSRYRLGSWENIQSRCSEHVDGSTTRGPSREALCVLSSLRGRAAQKLQVAGYITRGPSGATVPILLSLRGRPQGDNITQGGAQVSLVETCRVRHDNSGRQY